MDDNDYSANNFDSFVTSTPEKVFQCEDCNDKTQCTDCFVRQETTPLHRLHFAYDEKCEDVKISDIMSIRLEVQLKVN